MSAVCLPTYQLLEECNLHLFNLLINIVSIVFLIPVRVHTQQDIHALPKSCPAVKAIRDSSWTATRTA